LLLEVRSTSRDHQNAGVLGSFLPNSIRNPNILPHYVGGKNAKRNVKPEVLETDLSRVEEEWVLRVWAVLSFRSRVSWAPNDGETTSKVQDRKL